jgi:hypothetical protein
MLADGDDYTDQLEKYTDDTYTLKYCVYSPERKKK